MRFYFHTDGEGVDRVRLNFEDSPQAPKSLSEASGGWPGSLSCIRSGRKSGTGGRIWRLREGKWEGRKLLLARVLQHAREGKGKIKGWLQSGARPACWLEASRDINFAIAEPVLLD